MTENQQITHEILRQLGGSRFVVMTGAKHLCEVERGQPKGENHVYQAR